VPRPYSRPLIEDVVPVTGSEVEAWWRQILRRDPYPSPEDCALQARHLNAHIWHGVADRQRARHDVEAAAAARLVLAAMSDRLAPLERTSKSPPASELRYSTDAYNIFRAARLTLLEILAELDPVNFRLRPEHGARFADAEDLRRLDALLEKTRHRTRAPVWEPCAIICWLTACDALEAIGRKPGHTADSAAVKFAALAVKRLGFPGNVTGITPNAVAKRLRRLNWAPSRERDA